MRIHDAYKRSTRALRHTEASAKAMAGHSSEPRPITFAIRLPFNLALQHGAAFSMQRSLDADDPFWVQLVVHRVVISLRDYALQPYDAGLQQLLSPSDLDSSEGRSMQTWVMAKTVNTLFEGEGLPEDFATMTDEMFFSIAFQRCLDAVNRMVSAERVNSGQVWSRRVSKESLDREIRFFAEGLPNDGCVMTLHQRPINPGLEEAGEDFSELVRASIAGFLRSDATTWPHPLALSRDLKHTAQAQRAAGDATAALITLQTSAETYLRGLHRIRLVDDGLTAKAIIEAESCSFADVLTKHLPRLLGGPWTGVRSPAHEYRETLYSLRNRMSHGGHEPHWTEVVPAFESYERLTKWIEGLVKQRWTSRPRTLLALCEPWAGGTAKPPTRALELCNELVEEEAPYWLPWDLAGREPGQISSRV